MKWIPCSEKLPEEGKEVLITIRGSDVIVTEEGETLEQAIKRTWDTVCYVSTGYIGEDGWYTSDGYPEREPTAWMPFPPPYKEGENNEKETAQESPDKQGEES